MNKRKTNYVFPIIKSIYILQFTPVDMVDNVEQFDQQMMIDSNIPML